MPQRQEPPPGPWLPKRGATWARWRKSRLLSSQREFPAVFIRPLPRSFVAARTSKRRRKALPSKPCYKPCCKAKKAAPRKPVNFPGGLTVNVNSLDHLVLTVKDIETTCQFYQRALGMEVVSF